MVQYGYLQQKDLEKSIKNQVKDIFFEVLSWEKGSFRFSVKDVSRAEDIFLEERLDALIFQGVINRDEQN